MITATELAESILGTWYLVSFTQTFADTGETIDVFGRSPFGVINYGRDKRMIVLVVSDGRPSPIDLAAMTEHDRAELFRSMIAYAGTYTVGATSVAHHLDISWNQIFSGADQVRNIEIKDDLLIMSTNPQPRSQDGRVAVSILKWEQRAPGSRLHPLPTGSVS